MHSHDTNDKNKVYGLIKNILKRKKSASTKIVKNGVSNGKGLWEKEEEITLFWPLGFSKKGEKVHLMCASLNALCLWGFALNALRVLGAILTTLLTDLRIVYICYMMGGLIHGL